MTIYGDPGIGKSRLTRELLAWADAHGDGVTVLKGRCLPYGEAITYWPLAEILKSYTGVLDSDPPDVALAKIAALADDVLAGVPDPARSAGVLAFTFGLEDPRFGLATLPPRQVQLETHEAWRAFFTGLTADRPAIVVVEDIHWADDPLLDLLEELADRVAGPLLFVCPARPDLAQRRTGWGGGKRNFSSIFLEPLSHDDATTLVEVLLAVEELPDETREAMLARADGNPLFLEEIIRQLIDEGRIVRDGRRWRATEGIDEIEIPDTVQAVLAARIDLLPAVERSALLSASVVGRVFWSGSVAQLLDDGNELADDALGRLEDRELVLSQLGSRIAGEREFLFKHVLTRDVAYGTLARRDRARAHADVAAWIESAAGERQPRVRGPARPPSRSRLRRRARGPRCLGRPSRRAQATKPPCSTGCVGRGAEQDAARQGECVRRGRLGVAADAHERSLALEALGLCALWHYRGDDAWRNLSQAVDERLAAGRASGEDSRCSAPARSSLRRDGPHRWRNSRKRLRWPAMSRSASSTRPPTARHACVCSSRVACGCSRSSAIGFTDEDAETARQASEEAFALAEALGRDDLASAALDGVTSVEFITRPARADVARGGTQARDRRTAHGSVGGRRRIPDSGRHRARDRPLRRRAALGERGIRARPRRAGRLAGRAGVAGHRSLQARRLGRSHRGLRTHGGRACDDAVRNRRVLHAHDVELHRAALRASWRTSCSGQAGRRHGPGAPRYGDDPEDPVARKARGTPRVGRGPRANRGERVDCSAGRWRRARSSRRSAM